MNSKLIKNILILISILFIMIVSVGAISADDNVTDDDTINTVNSGVAVPVIDEKSNPQKISPEDSKYNEVSLSAKALKTTYMSGKTFDVTVKSKYGITYGVNDGMTLKNSLVKLKVYTGNKCKNYNGYTNSKGVVKFKLSGLPAGSHKIKMSCNDQNFHSTTYTSKITISKADPIVTAYRVDKEYKKKGTFTVTIKDDTTFKAIKNLKVKVKVYTGSKTKTYTLKTNKKGVATLNTKSMKIGNHKVVVSSGNSNYKIYEKSVILIGVKKKVTIKVGQTKKFKNGDEIVTFIQKRDGQNDRGVYCDIGGSESAHEGQYTSIAKIKFYFKNKKTGKVISKNVPRHYLGIGLIDGYTPIKADVWYLTAK